jgi:hypothetical protein
VLCFIFFRRERWRAERKRKRIVDMEISEISDTGLEYFFKYHPRFLDSQLRGRGGGERRYKRSHKLVSDDTGELLHAEVLDREFVSHADGLFRVEGPMSPERRHVHDIP